MTNRSEAGFTLLEVTVSTALIATVIIAAVGMFANVAREAEPDRTRDLATQEARNQLTYARAAVAYAPASETNVDTTALATFSATRTWALSPGDHTFTTTARLLTPGSYCGQSALGITVPLTVNTNYQETSGSHTFTVVVTYPPNPCVPATTSTVTLSEELGPVAFVPGTVVTRLLPGPPWGQ
jgi:Tfp pilus assembly protein FimT